MTAIKAIIIRSSFLFSFLLALALTFFSTQSKAEIAIITHLDSDIPSLSLEMVRAFYLGDLFTTNTGTPIVVVMQTNASPVRSLFDQQVLGIESEKLHSRWSGLVFSGKTSMPEFLNNDSEVVHRVLKQENTIGYIDKKNITDQVKLLYSSSP